jgi:hypothetical protein
MAVSEPVVFNERENGESLPAASKQAPSVPVLPVDAGFVVEAEVGQRFVKGEDIAFCFRADPGLLGRAMAQHQPDDPADWKLNYDIFVLCDGHSGIAVRSFTSVLHVLVSLVHMSPAKTHTA